MASSGHRSHDGYTPSPPSSDPHDPFGSQQNQHRFYDDGSEDPYTQRETYASDSSMHNYQDGERFYDQPNYDPYSALSNWSLLSLDDNSLTLMQPLIQKTITTVNATNPRPSRLRLPAWESPSRQHQQCLISVQALGMPIPPGRPNAKSRYPRKKLRISFWISLRSLVSRKTR